MCSRVCQRKGFIDAEGLVLTNVLHSVSRPPQEAHAPDQRQAAAAAGASTSSDTNGDENNAFKGSLLCLDRFVFPTDADGRGVYMLNTAEKCN